MKITSQTKQVKFTTITITADELYLNYLTSLKDVVDDSEGEISLCDYANGLNAILQGNGAGIRELFNEGNTFMMLPNAMQEIEEAVDVIIIIEYRDTVIEVLNEDINY